MPLQTSLLPAERIGAALRFVSFALMVLISGVHCCFAQSPISVAGKTAAHEISALDARVRAETAAFKGRVGIYAKNLDSGATYALMADEPVRTASTIKVAIMVEAFKQVSDGRAQWTNELTLTTAKKVSGAGILPELSDGLKIKLRDAVNLMMILSDNTATNLVLDVTTTDAVNDRMDALGLKNTKVMRKIGGGGVSRAGAQSENARFGLGKTTPREMVVLLEKLERGEVVNAAASKEMIELMKREQGRHGIGRTLAGVAMATKSGALDRLRSNVGILYTSRGRIAMAITCDDMPETIWTTDNPGLLLLSRLSNILIEGL